MSLDTPPRGESAGPPPAGATRRSRLRRSGESLALCGLSLVVGLILVEFVLGAVGYQYTPLAIRVERRGDARPYHLFQDEHFVYDPGLIWRPKRSYGVFNSQGFRGPRLASVKPPGEFRIFAVGDSNTLGWAGRGGPNWPADLARLISRADPRAVVLNAGVWGYSSYQGLIRFRKVLAFEPDLVLISFGSNDAHRVLTSDREFADRPLQRLDVDRLLGRWRLGQLILAVANGLTARDADSAAELKPRVGLGEYRENLGQIVRTARSRRVRVVLLTRPYTGPIGDPLWWKAFGADYNAATLAVATRYDVPLVDLYSYFKGRDELFEDDSHFTAEGHRLAARLIFDEVWPLLAGG